MTTDTEKDLEIKTLQKQTEELAYRNADLHTQLFQAKTILSDMLQCHSPNDHIGHRARELLNHDPQSDSSRS